MKIAICTTPIRPEPTTYPPLGSMAIIEALRGAGHDVSFYNIDYFRYSNDQVEAYFSHECFDIVGISAVVSTAYAYTKNLTEQIRRVSPATTIVVGGNLAASAEILLKKCQVDFCVNGDGEITMVELVSALSDNSPDENKYNEVKGISYLDRNGQFQFTGFGTVLKANEIGSPNWEILEEDGSIDHFITEDIPWDKAAMPNIAPGKRFGIIQTDKGCVARCTFCHRFERGYRARPVEQLEQEIQYLKDRYNIGAIGFATENFGSDKKVMRELVKVLGREGLYWRAGAVRVRSVDLQTLKSWRANGCTAVYFGIESGSQKVLDIMEKKSTVQMNIDAIRWVHEAGMFTILQFVVGMPGETDETIRESIEYIKKVTPYLFLKDGATPSTLLSINYAQALPGTPLYEYAREHGYIGSDLDAEERYLIDISDIDAYSTDHFVNYTQQPLLNVLLWRWWITAEVDAHYMQTTLGAKWPLIRVLRYFACLTLNNVHVRQKLPKFIADVLFRLMAESVNSEEGKEQEAQDKGQGGYFNIKSSYFAPLFLNSITRRIARPIMLIGVAYIHSTNMKEFLGMLGESAKYSIMRALGLAQKALPDRSLRKVVNVKPASENLQEHQQMMPLRLGR